MENIPRPFSPQYVPQPLCPSPFRTRSFPLERAATPAVVTDHSGSPQYLSTVSQPNEDPYTIIYDYYNVSPASFSLGPDGSVPRTVELPLARVSDPLPTHILAVLDSAWKSPSAKAILSRRPDTLTPAYSPPQTPQPSDPFLVPIDAESFFLSFGNDTARTLGPAALTSKRSWGPSPQIRADRATGARTIALPVIPLYVPHPPSFPHVLLFAQAIPLPAAATTSTIDTMSCSPSHPQQLSSASALATYLLPLAAIEEFPSAPAMAAAMARACTPEALCARAVFNDGAWRNVLELAPADGALVDLVRVARNVTADAVHLQRQVQQERRRERERAVRLPAAPPPPVARDRLVARAPAGAVASGSKAAGRDTARDEPDRDCERSKRTVQPAQIAPPVPAVRTADLPPPPRLPVVEVDYPLDFAVKMMAPDVPRAIPVGEHVEKRRAAQLEQFAAPVSHLERRSSQRAILERIPR